MHQQNAQESVSLAFFTELQYFSPCCGSSRECAANHETLDQLLVIKSAEMIFFFHLKHYIAYLTVGTIFFFKVKILFSL